MGPASFQDPPGWGEGLQILSPSCRVDQQQDEILVVAEANTSGSEDIVINTRCERCNRLDF